MDIKKVVIPSAGLGTRFLPATKAVPKEMLPVLDKPAVQWTAEEAMYSGINNAIFITGKNKGAIANHLDIDLELESILHERGQSERLRGLNKLTRNLACTYIRQSEPLGLGHAVLLSRNVVDREYFGIILPDDIFFGEQPALKQLINIARQEKCTVIGVQEVPSECVSSYGILRVKKQISPLLFQVADLIEKPRVQDAPSNLAIAGRYIISHKIFKSLEAISGYATEELQLTDGIAHMMRTNEKVLAYKIQSTRFDLGTPIGWLKANIGISLRDPRYSDQIKAFIKDLDGTNSCIFNPAKNISHEIV